MLASILVFVLLFTLFEPLAVSATTTGTKISNGIDYSGKGTVIDGDIRDGVATVNGDYVNVPIYTYGAYTYDTWDEFWATWSSWSTSNSKYSGYKGYRYAPENKHIVDFESKTEYQYRRWNDKLNPVYKTKYITKYQKCTKVLFVNVYTYHTEYSYSGYPGAKSGYTIYSRRTERVLDYYRGGYEYYGAWSDSKPFTMPWETSWTSYNSRKTYRVKKIDCTWDPDWKNESTERVPLNYSLYNHDGSPMAYGIMVQANPTISENLGTNFLNPTSDDRNYKTTYFYFTTESLKNELERAFLNSKATDPVTLYIQALLQSSTATVSVAIGLAAEKFSESAVIAALGSACTYISAIILPFAITNIVLQLEKEAKFTEFTEELKRLDEYKIYAVEFTRYYDLDSTMHVELDSTMYSSHSNSSISLPSYYMETALLDKKSTSSDDITYVSAKILNNKKLNSEFDVFYDSCDLDYYGDVTYIKNFDKYESCVEAYFDSYDIFNVISWFS